MYDLTNSTLDYYQSSRLFISTNYKVGITFIKIYHATLWHTPYVSPSINSPPTIYFYLGVLFSAYGREKTHFYIDLVAYLTTNSSHPAEWSNNVETNIPSAHPTHTLDHQFLIIVLALMIEEC